MSCCCGSDSTGDQRVKAEQQQGQEEQQKQKQQQNTTTTTTTTTTQQQQNNNNTTTTTATTTTPTPPTTTSDMKKENSLSDSTNPASASVTESPVTANTSFGSSGSFKKQPSTVGSSSSASSSSSTPSAKDKIALVSFGHPLLDIISNRDKDFLDKYGVTVGSSNLVKEAQLPIFKDLASTPEKVQYVAGGSAMNSARIVRWLLRSTSASSAVASVGAHTAMVGAVGVDEFGKILRTSLQQESVDFFFFPKIEDATPTGTCAVLVTEGERSLLANIAAALKLNRADIDIRVRTKRRKSSCVNPPNHQQQQKQSGAEGENNNKQGENEDDEDYEDDDEEEERERAAFAQAAMLNHRSSLIGKICDSSRNISYSVQRAFDECTCIYMEGFFMNLVDRETSISVAEKCTAASKIFSFNLSAPYLSSIFPESLKRILPHVDILFGSRIDAEAYAKSVHWDECFANEGEEDPLPAVVKKLAEMPRINCCTSAGATTTSTSTSTSSAAATAAATSGGGKVVVASSKDTKKEGEGETTTTTTTTTSVEPSSFSLAESFSGLPQNMAQQEQQSLSENNKRRMVVITDGAAATIVGIGVSKTFNDCNIVATVTTYQPDRIPPEQIVDSNGAGDAFSGGFLTGFLLGKSIDQCVELGHKSANIILRHSGCTFPPAPPFEC